MVESRKSGAATNPVVPTVAIVLYAVVRGWSNVQRDFRTMAWLPVGIPGRGAGVTGVGAAVDAAAGFDRAV